MSSSLNIILFGEAGVGKSSVINLIAGRHVADTSPDVQGCTMSFKPYTFPVNSRTFHIWDTVGLEEPEMGNNGYLPAIEQACELIHHLSSQGGVDLLLFCIRGDRVTATTQSNYRLFFEVLCKSRVPIALVITHLEREADMEKWWERNAESLEKYGIKAAGHACVTGLPTHSKYRESQRNIARLLEGHNSQGRFNMPPERWLIEILRLFGLFAPLKRKLKRKDIVKVLTKRCKLDAKVAEELATELESGFSHNWKAGPHTVGLERKDDRKSRMIGSGVAQSLLRVSRKQNSGAALAVRPSRPVPEISDIHSSEELGDAKNTAEVDPRSANVPPGKDKSGIASENGGRDHTSATPHGDAHASAAGDSSHPLQSPSINVVLFGEIGVGKSSVINLIARKEVARVSLDVNGCTMQSTRYDISFDDMNFAIFDTVGLQEPHMGVNGYLKAIEKAYELVVKLGAAGGVHLLLFCMRGERITATTQSNYRLFCECLCSTKVPIALVFTGREREAEMEDWWVRNKTHIEHYGIKSNGHACITAVQDDAPGEDLKYIESQRKIRELLKTCALQNDPFSLELHPWPARRGRGLRSFIGKHRDPQRRDVMRVLTHRCKLDPETAEKIASMMEGDTETKEGNQDEQEGIKENEGRSNPGHVKDEVGDVKKNTAEVDPHSANVPRGKDKSGIASEKGARDRAPATPHGDGEAGPHTVGLERKDGGKPRIDESLVVVEQAMSERVDTIRPSVSVQEISDIHSSGKLGDTKNMTEVDPRSANVSRGKDKNGITSKNAARDPTSMMEKGDTETKDGKDEDPGQCSFEELERLGDAEVGAKRYNEAISHYSTALSLFSSSQTILIKRSKAWLANGSWKEALDDANQVTTLDPSSPWGYELKHAALHEIGDYDNAIVAFETMVSKIKHWPDPAVQQKDGGYISSSSTQETIRRIVQQTIRHLPRVLINTTTGRLHDRAEHASAFESLPIFKELVSSMTKRIDYVRIEQEVRQYFRYVMLSHKWEENEPLFQKVIHIAVYDLDKSPTHDKLQTFCKIVRGAGFNWAWSDTCCIDKSDNFVLQEALVAMFRWYEGSTMVIVFLRGVRPSPPCGALAASVWNTRAWTLQEYIAAKVIRFYTEDWTLYRDLDLPNHKESPEIILEMEQATGISAQQLMALSPGLSCIREKLRLASTRRTTWIEDTAYSLLGIFSVVGISAIYGEGEASLGRLLANLMTRSGDASILAWTGESSHFNSCLPTHISVFNGSAASHLPSPISDPEMERIITGLQAPSFDLDTALRLYDRLIELPTPRFAESRMTLPCIAFQLPPFSVHRTALGRVYLTKTFPFGVLEIRTRHDLSRMKTIYLVHPWLDTLLQHENMQSAAFVEDVVQPASPDTDDGEIFDEEIGDDSLSLPELPSPVDIVSTDKDDRETRAQRLVARLRQPFGALLFTLASDRRSTDYRRVAADSMTTVQFHDNISLADILDNVRILDVL